MKKYLIRIESFRGSSNKLSELVHIYGDNPSRPFSIAHNWWNYTTPWHAGQRLERIAKRWEACGIEVTRTYGSVEDMPTKGNLDNAHQIRRDWMEWAEWTGGQTP